ncbi:MAG: outer membrane beta-barrel protein [Gemmatimonadaceae bacterium]|nr:outer membrane beta-barrel protein [Gemmatimonadaceae bacterium]
MTHTPPRSPRARTLLAGVVAATLALATPAIARAQGGHFGAIVGATFSTLRGIDGLDSRTGLIGGLSNVSSGSVFTLQTELLFVSKGAKGSNSTAEGLQLDYIEVPIMLRFQPMTEGTVHPHAYAGPYVGFKIDCKVKGTSGSCDDIPGVSTKTVDVGGLLGGGIDFDLGPVVLTGGMRYSFGVSSVADFDLSNVRQSAKNGVFALYTGAAIRIGGRR